ncbi:MAG TPA: hypothetical protein VN521_00980 [Negativicutes bacterium]|nr:hypothetical protein [Negativicutes bacterium]
MVWLVVVVAAGVALFAVPLRFRLKVHGEGRPEWQAEVVWLGGLVCIARDAGGGWFRLGGIRRNLPTGEKAAASAPQKARSGSVVARWRAIASAERRAFVHMLRKIWAATKFAIRGSFRYGFDDPAVTAWLYAAYCAVRGTGRLPQLHVEADFAQEGWSGRVEAGWSFRPLMIFVPVLKFLFICAGRRVKKMMTGGKSRWQVQT